MAHDRPVMDAKFSPDGSLLAVGASDHTASIRRTADLTRTLTLRGHNGPLYFVDFSPSGKLVVTAAHEEEEPIRVWNTQTGEQVQAITGLQKQVLATTFTPDDSRLVAALGEFSAPDFFNYYVDYQHSRGISSRYEIKLWDLPSGKELLGLPEEVDDSLGYRHLSFDRKGRTLLSSRVELPTLVRTSVPWKTEDLPGDQDEPWLERYRAWQKQRYQSARLGQSLPPTPLERKPKANAGPAILAESFDSMDSIDDRRHHPGWNVEEGTLFYRQPSDGDPLRMPGAPFILFGPDDAINYAVEVDVTLDGGGSAWVVCGFKGIPTDTTSQIQNGQSWTIQIPLEGRARPTFLDSHQHERLRPSGPGELETEKATVQLRVEVSQFLIRIFTNGTHRANLSSANTGYPQPYAVIDGRKWFDEAAYAETHFLEGSFQGAFGFTANPDDTAVNYDNLRIYSLEE